MRIYRVGTEKEAISQFNLKLPMFNGQRGEGAINTSGREAIEHARRLHKEKKESSSVFPRDETKRMGEELLPPSLS